MAAKKTATKKDATATTTTTATTATKASFTKEDVAQVTEVTLRHTLEQTLALATGIAAAHAAVTKNATKKKKADEVALDAQLTDAGITADDADELLEQGAELIASMRERDRKRAIYEAAVAVTHAEERHLHGIVGAVAMQLRGKLGAKSPQLTSFGIKPFAVGGRRKKGGPDDGSSTPPGTGGK